MPTLRDNLRAAGVLLACLALGVAGTPGLDRMGPKLLDNPAKVDRWADRFPRPAVQAVAALAALNRHVRLPIVRVLTPLERQLRAEQTWNLYGNGPDDVRRLEILVDGELVHRSCDPDLAWRAAQLGSRRIRPVIETVALKPRARNAAGLTRLIGQYAQQDFGGQTVTLRYTVAPFPTAPAAAGVVYPSAVTGGGARIAHQLEATAPDWTPTLSRP